MKLSTAEDALRASKPEVALEALLEVWRALRHPRLSELIERVSNQLTATKGPLAEKSVSKQLEAAIALHQKHDPAELGRLLKVKWPGTWQKAVPLLEALLSWPNDPRIEQAVANLLAEPPWESMASWGFFSRLRPAIDAFSDARIIATLEASQSRAHPWWYESYFRSNIDACLTRLRAQPPALDPDTLEALARLESHFAESKAREQDKSHGEKELLADIYERPGDLGARAVFADWLVERNDPRGELIALQLAPARTRAQDARLNALLATHGSDWAGPLDEWFDREVRFLEGGFLTGGLLVERAPRSFEEAAKLPGWRLVKTLELNRWTPDPSALFAVCPLETLHGAEEPLFVDLCLGAPRALKELSNGRWTFDREVPAQLDGALPGLPKLETLGLRLNAATFDWVKRGEVFKRLKRLRVTDDTSLRPLLAFLRSHLPNIVEVEVLSSRPDSWLAPGNWRTTLRRHAAGDFTELTLNWEAGRRSFDAFDLVQHLSIVDASKVTRLEVNAGRSIKLKASDLERVDDSLAQFTNAVITVPWERAAAKKSKPPRTGPMLDLQLTGESLLQPDMESLWKHLQALGLQFDSYSVGYGSAHRELGARPVTTVNKWGTNARCNELKLYEDGTEEDLRLERPKHGNEARTHLRFHWSQREVSPFLDWLETFLDAWQFDSGTAWANQAMVRQLATASGPAGGWLTIFGSKQLPYFPPTGLKTLLAAFPGSFARKTKRNLILGASASPLETQPLEQLGLAVEKLVLEAFNDVQQIDFLEVARAQLAGPAKALGLEPTASEPRQIAFQQGRFTLRAKLFNLLATPRIEVSLRASTDKEYSTWELPLSSGAFEAKKVPALLDEALRNLEQDARQWMVDPSTFKHRRR